MSGATPRADDRSTAGDLRRQGVIASSNASEIDVHWTEATCRGCVGCGGRCSLFANADGGPERLRVEGGPWAVGTTVDVVVSAPRLRRSASLAYGVALASLVIGAMGGHAAGDALGAPNLGAFLGLMSGTFLAGRLTKRIDAAPPLRVEPCATHDPQDPTC